jgi:glycosyltransferase involved in cell wall biosynthesis
VLDAATCVSSLLLSGSHDIVLWPAEIEGFGLVGVESIYMGTPIIAYDVPPMSDIVIDGINGVLVPCKHGGAANNIVFAEPNAYNFIDKSVDAINNKLVELNKHTKTGKKSKRSKFNSAWKKIIEG